MNSTRKSGYALLIGALLMLTGASGQVPVTQEMVQRAKAMGASDAQINAAMHATSPSSSQTFPIFPSRYVRGYYRERNAA